MRLVSVQHLRSQLYSWMCWQWCSFELTMSNEIVVLARHAAAWSLGLSSAALISSVCSGPVLWCHADESTKSSCSRSTEPKLLVAFQTWRLSQLFDRSAVAMHDRKFCFFCYVQANKFFIKKFIFSYLYPTCGPDSKAVKGWFGANPIRIFDL